MTSQKFMEGILPLRVEEGWYGGGPHEYKGCSFSSRSPYSLAGIRCDFVAGPPAEGKNVQVLFKRVDEMDVYGSFELHYRCYVYCDKEGVLALDRRPFPHWGATTEDSFIEVDRTAVRSFLFYLKDNYGFRFPGGEAEEEEEEEKPNPVQKTKEVKLNPLRMIS